MQAMTVVIEMKSGATMRREGLDDALMIETTVLVIEPACSKGN